MLTTAGLDPEDPYAGGDPRDDIQALRPDENTDFRLACKDDALKSMRVAVRGLMISCTSASKLTLYRCPGIL